MKKIIIALLCLSFLLILGGCKSEDADSTAPATPTDVATKDEVLYEDNKIIGTWVCDDINKECYFIFDEKGDAYAKWGTCTVYGYYDYYDDEKLYDIDIPNFLYNEYSATFSKDKMTLKSDEYEYTFKKATMPKVEIKAPNNLTVDKAIVGDWQSVDNYECYRFNEDGTAVITDLYSDATIDCKYGCKDDKVTIYSMSSPENLNEKELTYKALDDGNLVLNDYTYEPVQN